MFISINKKIISTTLILLFFLFSGINTHNDISAQMPMTGGDFYLKNLSVGIIQALVKSSVKLR